MLVSLTNVIAVLLASVLAAGLSALAASRQKRTDVVPWWGALAVGLADIVGHVGIAPPSWPPGDVTDRIPVVAVVGAIVAAILAGHRGVLWARVIGAIGLGSLATLLILGPVLGAGVSPYLATIAVALLAMTNVALLDTPSSRRELWVALTVLAGGAGLILVLANSLVLMKLGGSLALILAASLLGARGRPIGGGILVASAVLTALIVEGTVYAFLPTKPALLLAAAPTLLWLNRIGPIRNLGPNARSAIAVGLMLIPVGIAIALMLTSEATESYGY